MYLESGIPKERPACMDKCFRNIVADNDRLAEFADDCLDTEERTNDDVVLAVDVWDRYMGWMAQRNFTNSTREPLMKKKEFTAAMKGRGFTKIKCQIRGSQFKDKWVYRRMRLLE
jgi:hypothetical protein